MGLAAGTAIFLAFGVLWLARERAGYSHLQHTISELGERGAPRERLVAWGLFMPVGAALALVAAQHRETSPDAAALAACIAIGYLGAAFFPCDPGSPLRGSTRQTLHNLAGGVEYAGGCLALYSLGRGSMPYLAASVLVGLAAVVLSSPVASGFRGGAQRLAEICLFGALVAALAPGATS